ncbi:fumarate reductase cytochrome b subunit [Helicobacter sp. MIT 14-3879]|uniref:fumarate reductase cytochrome b subunit n=1 Tax=Helicobacter sp. MIT 14-3879 TaxID=2040649 RepID=UPI000E1E2E38|nr:fumarate reductase cytochrome b subunit [Helicobacter sp. MIT 14-3879]RDU62431.1 fumarate reductase cytochrome subunit b [Helicobacter sp. MIT 14-3879]
MGQKDDNNIIESYTGVAANNKASRIPAILDWLQSATGLFLALFMIAHMFFVSTILISEKAMYKVTKFFELSFLSSTGEGCPLVVSIIAFVVFVIFILHAFLATRKFPINYRQYLRFKTHKNMLHHGDTNLWGIQACTGFAMFFLGSIHLYIMMTQPQTIGPVGSAYRFVHQHFWILYIVLLFAVELHGSIGLYRLAVKWGWFEANTPQVTLKRLRVFKTCLSVFFIVLGLLTYAAYVKKGLSLDSNIDYMHYEYKEFKQTAQKPIVEEIIEDSEKNVNEIGGSL